MHAYPHTYPVSARADVAGPVELTASGVPDLTSVAPREFDGPGDQWSPESLLSAAVAGCFILTFRAIARVSKLEWQQLDCRVEGTLERVDGVPQFTRFVTHATLKVPVGTNVDLCRRLLEKAEHSCLIANSLRSRRELRVEVLSATS